MKWSLLSRCLTNCAEKIKAPLWAMNSDDVEVNPPELALMSREITEVARGRYILTPT